MSLSARIKDPFAGLSHWAGALLASIGVGFLLVRSFGKPLPLIAFAIYGVTLIGLYAASGAYHTYRGSLEKERLLRKLDHLGIYLLIAGTYVPVCLLALAPQWGISFLVLQAILATIGIVATFGFSRFPSGLNVVLYLLMGWIAVAAAGYLRDHWPSYATSWLLAGGIVYSIGAIIYSLDRPHLWPGKFSAHDLWHVFVLGGSTCHFLLMATYISKLS